MNPKVNIVVVVDVIGALSDGTLLNGNLCMIDDGEQSTGQGTPELCTVVRPGQVVTWSALAVDLQTPVEIKGITFLGADAEDGDADAEATDAGAGAGAGADGRNGQSGQNGRGGRNGHGPERHNPELEVWSGVVPQLAPGVAHQYRLEVQMYEGEHSTLHIASPALMCQ
ncbi:hypothetical protein GCM10010331_12830 [Streptomyces xanthochromogenes]|uniref:hypothetical protein n=1 Tax=Streptomyces xanthochromogenes TaxID=67384 RepID=UPI001679ADAB|nr:hypothetical protein [Streptomyces xanthochromogenes]GHB27892.1 hypothetical protein GCM10010331_12830 [Streptomyces xanthochromogenes]